MQGIKLTAGQLTGNTPKGVFFYLPVTSMRCVTARQRVHALHRSYTLLAAEISFITENNEMGRRFLLAMLLLDSSEIARKHGNAINYAVRTGNRPW